MRDIRQKAVDESVIGDSLVQRFRPSWRIILFPHRASPLRRLRETNAAFSTRNVRGSVEPTRTNPGSIA